MEFFMRNAILAVLAGTILAVCARADEGMWLYNAPPLKILKDRYQFEPDANWLEHLQKSSVRFGQGGSASFVSPDGLVMTNHHVGRDALTKLSTKDRALAVIGFQAKSRDEELKCHDLELVVLQSMVDVTDKVNGAVKADAKPDEAEKARRAAMNTIEKEALDKLDKNRYRCDVVTLYQGGQYHLYTYKKYTDVRLVFAPDGAIAHFGGDPDNFEYPRYCLDMCFFRVYEDGKPAKVDHYLKWSEAGAKEDELVFVSGHPGRTSRLNTVAHLTFNRDVQYPSLLSMFRRREVVYKTWADRDAENARRAMGELMRVQNSRKLLTGMVDGLLTPAIFEKKIADEKALRAEVKDDEAWKQIETSVDEMRTLYRPYQLFEASGRGLGSPWVFNTQLFGIARTLVRYAEEKEKPNAERLREYRESNLESLKQLLFSPAPIYDDFETVKLADSLSLFAEMRTADAPLVKRILDGLPPSARAAELIKSTKLRDVAERKKLFEGGKPALEASDDPMIRLAMLVDAPSRQIRKQYEEKVEEPQHQAYGKISRAIFAAKGKDQYPDATFTLRLAFGTVKGYEENGKKVAPWTTFGGAFKHADDHGGRDPFDLPKSWTDKRDKIDPNVPFNIVCTADIIGGNSGSPVVNKKGEVVGLIFDGNIQSLVADFAYTDTQGRAVAVHSRGIIESLRQVYGVTALADEITGKK
jgi:hypothetical protein